MNFNDLNFYSAKMDSLMMQTYFHHAAGIFGTTLGLYLNDNLGSSVHLTIFSEFSTFFVNMRIILVWHKLSSSPVYFYNGLLMTLSFFFVRILFYPYIQLYTWNMYGVYTSQFWVNYPAEKVTICQIGIFSYWVMYFL